MDLEKLIKTFNLIFTNTSTVRDFCRVNYDRDKDTVNYENSISLYDLVFSFNKLYNAFKKKYDALDKFDFCKEQFPKWYSEFNSDGHYRDLEIFIDGCDPKRFKNHEYLELNLREIDGKNTSFVISEEHNPFDPNYYYSGIEIDDDIVKKYLDLFQEYNFLMELFYHLRQSTVFSDGTHSLFSSFNNYNIMFGEEVDTFKFSVFASYFDMFNEVIITLKLGDELTIDLDNSRIALDEKKIDINSDMCFEILKRIYINGKYLEDYSSQKREEKGEQKRKILKSNSI